MQVKPNFKNLNNTAMQLKHSEGTWTYEPCNNGFFLKAGVLLIVNISNESDVRLCSQSPAMLKLLGELYVDYLLTMASDRRNSAEGQDILCNIRNQICDATGFSEQIVQEHYEAIAFNKKYEK
jgi:hypothetical protein